MKAPKIAAAKATRAAAPRWRSLVVSREATLMTIRCSFVYSLDDVLLALLQPGEGGHHVCGVGVHHRAFFMALILA